MQASRSPRSGSRQPSPRRGTVESDFARKLLSGNSGIDFFDSTGSTTMSALVHLRQARRRNTQNTRSAGRSLGRPCRRLKTASCWRRARFSTINPSRDRNNARAKATVSVKARQIMLRALPAGHQSTSQTPSLLSSKTQGINHYRIMSTERRFPQDSPDPLAGSPPQQLFEHRSVSQSDRSPAR